MATNVSEIRNYIRNDFNILLQGKHGTGKTSILLEACKLEGLKLKIFNAASMDPFTNLVGVPKFASDSEGRDYLISVRPHEIDDAEVIFIDELNRAQPETTNAVFEMIQFHTINGEPLPKLKCVIAAQNPPDDKDAEYDVRPLDPALVDRFHITLDVTPSANASYLATKFDRRVADALANWYRNRTDKADYVSPRRLEMLGQVYMKTKSKSALRAAFPPEGKFDYGALYQMLSDATKSDEQIAADRAKQEADLTRLAGRRSSKTDPEAVMKSFETQISLGVAVSGTMVRRTGPAVIATILEKTAILSLREAAIEALRTNIAPYDLVTKYTDALAKLSTDDILEVTHGWSSSKLSNNRTAVRALSSAQKAKIPNWINTVK